MKKNGVFLFVISHLVPEIFKIFVLCKIGTDDVIRCALRKSLCPLAFDLLFVKNIYHVYVYVV